MTFGCFLQESLDGCLLMEALLEDPSSCDELSLGFLPQGRAPSEMNAHLLLMSTDEDMVWALRSQVVRLRKW